MIRMNLMSKAIRLTLYVRRKRERRWAVEPAVYGLIDSVRKELFYVGSTSRPSRRLYDHRRGKGNNCEGNSPKVKARVAVCRQLGQPVQMVILEKLAQSN